MRMIKRHEHYNSKRVEIATVIRSQENVLAKKV